MATFNSFAEANIALNNFPQLEKEQNFIMEFHTIAGVEYKLIKATKALIATETRGAWLQGQWMWVKEKAK